MECGGKIYTKTDLYQGLCHLGRYFRTARAYMEQITGAFSEIKIKYEATHQTAFQYKFNINSGDFGKESIALA